MLDGLKMGAKLAILITAVAAIVLLMSTLTFPSPDYTAFNDGLGHALAIGNHWVPAFSLMIDIVRIELGFILALYAFKFGLFAYKWVLKVNE